MNDFVHLLYREFTFDYFLMEMDLIAVLYLSSYDVRWLPSITKRFISSFYYLLSGFSSWMRIGNIAVGSQLRYSTDLPTSQR